MAVRRAHVRSRWWDKQQLVFGPDGSAASLLEHSPVDGHVSLSLFRLVDEQSRVAPPPPQPAQRNAAPVREIKFDVDARARAQRCRATRARLCCANSVGRSRRAALRRVWHRFCQEIGRLARRVVPDGVSGGVLSKQHERTDSTYESVNMKHFMGGRTETLRSVTPASALLQRLWDADEVRLQSGQVTKVTPKMKADALREACAAHVKRGGEAKGGRRRRSAHLGAAAGGARQAAPASRLRDAGVLHRRVVWQAADVGDFDEQRERAVFRSVWLWRRVQQRRRHRVQSQQRSHDVLGVELLGQAAPLRAKLVETLREARALLDANPLPSKQQKRKSQAAKVTTRHLSSSRPTNGSAVSSVSGGESENGKCKYCE
jgi:hypothetical protein